MSYFHKPHLKAIAFSSLVLLCGFVSQAFAVGPAVPKLPAQEKGFTRVVTDSEGSIDPGIRLVRIYEDGKYACTGWAVSSDYVATSGHCFSFPSNVRKAGSFSVGYTDPKSKEEVTLAVKDHEGEFNSENQMDTHNMSVLGDGKIDFSIARLEKPIPGLPKKGLGEESCKDASELFVVGYGLNEKGTLPNQPQSASYLVRERKDFTFLGKAKGKARACFGDSGSPVVCFINEKAVLAGFLSGILASDKKVRDAYGETLKLPPEERKKKKVMRDYEYCRKADLMVVSRIDMLEGLANVFLQKLDEREALTGGWRTRAHPEGFVPAPVPAKRRAVQ